MSLTNEFTKLIIGQAGGENADIDMNTLQIPVSSQNTSAPPSSIQTSAIDKAHTRKSKQPREDVFTFVTVYYKRGEWGTRVYDTLREGLLEFVKDRDLTERQTLKLVSMDDQNLLHKMLILGKDDIEMQRGTGLVGIVKGPDLPFVTDLDEPTVYLELYYKGGEWKLRDGRSVYMEEAMDDLESKMGSDKWNKLCKAVQIEVALEQSKEDVREQRGWGVVELILGTIYAKL